MESSVLPLQQVIHDYLALVERETGSPARLVDDPDLPTGQFTGLHLVCLAYVAFKQVAP